MKALPHQIEKAEECYEVLKSKGLVYLAGEVRSGKTLTAILTAEKTIADRVLVLTKKAAIDGWLKFGSFMDKFYHITNYEQASKLDKDRYDLIIIDEAHNLGAIGKPSKRVKEIRALAYDKPVILMSGTPHAETKASLYHQMCITDYSPFSQWRNFYRFFDVFGIVDIKYIAGRQIKEYKRTKPELDLYIEEYFVAMTQADAGIKVEQKEIVHYLELDEKTKGIYNKAMKEQVLNLIDKDGNSCDIIMDSDMKLRVSLHQIEAGIIKR